MVAIVRTALIGSLPIAVSPLSITADVPSNTALAMSAASAHTTDAAWKPSANQHVLVSNYTIGNWESLTQVAAVVVVVFVLHAVVPSVGRPLAG